MTHASWKGGYGNCIIIDHGNGISTLYGHLSKIHVKKGQKVVREMYIDEVGSTGNSNGPHLHLGVLKNGSYVNPEKGWVSVPYGVVCRIDRMKLRFVLQINVDSLLADSITYITVKI